MRIFVTGVAGFIGSHLADHFLSLGHEVTGYDNFSTGHELFLDEAKKSEGFRLVRADLLDLDTLVREMAGSELVLHLAANADVRFGAQHPRRDLEQNTIATWNVAEAARRNEVERIAFSSTGSVYGESEIFPTPESCPFPRQTSLYGASKLAGEGLLQAYAEAFGIRTFIFRFVSILGERYTHGHIFDFLKQLRQHPDRLHILGNGRQRKSYLYVSDCVSAIATALGKSRDRVNIFNLGTDEFCEVNQSVSWITERLGLTPERTYGGGERGWIGDSPFIFLDCSRIRALGWTPRLRIRDAVWRTVDYLCSNAALLEARS